MSVPKGSHTGPHMCPSVNTGITYMYTNATCASIQCRHMAASVVGVAPPVALGYMSIHTVLTWVAMCGGVWLWGAGGLFLMVI
jgi:hypothetical protein